MLQKNRGENFVLSLKLVPAYSQYRFYKTVQWVGTPGNPYRTRFREMENNGRNGTALLFNRIAVS
jgi:hypothetical protein